MSADIQQLNIISISVSGSKPSNQMAQIKMSRVVMRGVKRKCRKRNNLASAYICISNIGNNIVWQQQHPQYGVKRKRRRLTISICIVAAAHQQQRISIISVASHVASLA